MIWTDIDTGVTSEISDDLSTPKAGETAAALVVRRRKSVTSRERMRVLGKKAALYAKSISNPQLTAREINELLARLVLADAADDQ